LAKIALLDLGNGRPVPIEIIFVDAIVLEVGVVKKEVDEALDTDPMTPVDERPLGTAINCGLEVEFQKRAPEDLEYRGRPEGAETMPDEKTLVVDTFVDEIAVDTAPVGTKPVGIAAMGITATVEFKNRAPLGFV
jgi:hypothetical protein